MRGIVMDIKKGKAVILQKDGAMTTVKDKGYKIGQTITMTGTPYKKLIIMAACLMLALIGGASGYGAYQTPSSYIYVDINPSVRLNVNCFDKVISVTPLNADAASLMDAYTITSSDTARCIDNLVNACEQTNYLNADNDTIELNVATKKSSVSERVTTITETLEDEKWQVSVHRLDDEENDQALHYRTSPKRLKAVKAYTEAFGGTLEENFAALKGVSNKDIYARMEAAGVPIEQLQNGSYRSHPERLEAVKQYTETFGGTLEENMQALKGISSAEIYAAIENKTPLVTTTTTGLSASLPQLPRRLLAL